MPMLTFVYRKMWKTRWLTFSAWIGLMIAVAFTVSIPMYADGSLKRVVAKTLQERTNGLPAGSLLVRYQKSGNAATDLAGLASVDAFMGEQLPGRIGFPAEAYVRTRSLQAARLVPVNAEQANAGKVRQMELADRPGIVDRIDITGGRMFKAGGDGDVVEAIVYEEALFRSEMRVGDEFYYSAPGDKGNVRLTVRIVGTYKPKRTDDLFWYAGADAMLSTLVVDSDVFAKKLLQDKKLRLFSASWYYAFDLRNIKTGDLSALAGTLTRLDPTLEQKLPHTTTDISFLAMLGEFKKMSDRMQAMLFTLAAPMLAMVFYYIAMNARQSLERQRGDIAVLRSRGGSTGQIIRIFLLEGLLLGVVALLAGPALGWLMAKGIGSASGFLTFAERKSLTVEVSLQALLYGGLAVLLAIASSLIPAIAYARQSIVGYKQKQARADRKPMWQRLYLDVALLALAGYGWYLFHRNELLTVSAGLSSDELQVQPYLFFVPAMAIFAAGLFCLRVFPWLVRGLLAASQRLLPVPLYLTLTRLSRSATSYYPLMLLLVLTLGLGVYNGSAARTIDTNQTDRTEYAYGADVVLTPIWEGVSEEQAQEGQTQSITYTEPPFEAFREAPGVAGAARVLQAEGKVAVSGKSLGKGRLLGIDNVDFAAVATFRDGLLPAHQNRYLNLLAAYEQAVLVPSSFAQKYNIKPGDTVTLNYQQTDIELVVVGTVPYWPSQYPDASPFFIANLDYIYSQVPLAPYEVWLKMHDGAKVTPVLEHLAAQQIAIGKTVDVRGELITQNNHPLRGGVFGILSLGFIISAIVSLVGYLLYWFFTLSGRVVQLGTLRAMGLFKRQLTAMLLLEQLLTAGLSIMLGLGLGKLAGKLFLPFLQASDGGKQVPPFRIVFDAHDTQRIYMVVAFMMLAGAALLAFHIRKLRVHQAVKLGEER